MPEPSEEQIGDRVRRLREGRGLTQRELGRRLRISQPVIANIERGTAQNLKSSTLETFADFFGVSVDYLLGRGLRPGDPADGV